MPRPVIDAVQAHLWREAEHGGYEAEDEAAEAIQAAYHSVARLIGSQARNIAVVENATAGFSQALSAFDFAPGDVIVTTRNDYVSNQVSYWRWPGAAASTCCAPTTCPRVESIRSRFANWPLIPAAALWR